MALRALLFDYGGTLDAPGVPWVERFIEIYASEGLGEAGERVRQAFGHATRCAYADRGIRGFGLEPTVRFHVERQLEFLGCRDDRLVAAVVDRFVRAARADLEGSRAVLGRLRSRFQLGVVSNFYGNVHILLAEAGIAPLLSVIVDSTRAGVSKPEAAIFRLALDTIACRAADAMHVGDSFDKDVAGARAAGLQTAWLAPAYRPCPDPSLVDVRLQALSDLERLLR